MPDEYGRDLLTCSCGQKARLSKSEIEDWLKRHKEAIPDRDHKITA